jgi:hypothetical protein
MPCTPTEVSASRTSSSLNGLMMAMTSFMTGSSPIGAGQIVHPGSTSEPARLPSEAPARTRL